MSWTRATAGIGEAGVGTDTGAGAGVEGAFLGFSGEDDILSFRGLLGVVGTRDVDGAGSAGSGTGDDVTEETCGVCDCPDDVEGRDGTDAAPGVDGRDNEAPAIEACAAAFACAAFRRSAARVRAFDTGGGSFGTIFPLTGGRARPLDRGGRLLVKPGIGRCAGTAAAVTGVVAPF